MLVSIQNFIGTAVMSLQTGTELSRTTTPIIDPRQLCITAFMVDGPNLDVRPSVLHPADIREVSELGLIVDSADRLVSLDGLVRLEEVMDFGFEPVGLKVVDEQGRKLGRVTGYSIETDSYRLMQLYTERSLLKSFSTMSSTIHRTQIVSVNNEVVVVQSPTIRDKAAQAVDTASRPFVNPLRQGAQPDHYSSSDRNAR